MTEIKVQAADAADIIELRTKILRPGQWPIPENYPQDNLPDTVHFSANAAGNAIGIATFIRNPPPVILSDLDHSVALQLRGMGVRDDYRRKGVGAKLLIFATHYFGETIYGGKTLLWFNAREVAIPFYESMGFLAVGEFFSVPKIGPHKVMSKLLGDPN